MTGPPELRLFSRSAMCRKISEGAVDAPCNPFPKIHDLLELLPLVPKALALGIQLADIAEVNRYAIEGRYPGEWEPITREDAEAAVKVARRVREAVRRHLPDAALKT